MGQAEYQKAKFATDYDKYADKYYGYVNGNRITSGFKSADAARNAAIQAAYNYFVKGNNTKMTAAVDPKPAAEELEAKVLKRLSNKAK